MVIKRDADVAQGIACSSLDRRILYGIKHAWLFQKGIYKCLLFLLGLWGRPVALLVEHEFILELVLLVLLEA